MRRGPITAVFIAACLSGCLLGCRKSQRLAPAPSASGSALKARPSVPTDLDAFESGAEALSEAARDRNWAKAETSLAKLHETWATLRITAERDGASANVLRSIDDALSRCDANVISRSSQSAESNANAMSLLIPDLFDRYLSAVPPDVLRLDAAFRRLQIDAEFSDWSQADAHLSSLLEVWRRVKPSASVLAPRRSAIPGASTVVDDIDHTLAAAGASVVAKSSTDTVTHTEHGLDLVDVVEQLFEQ